MVQKLLQFAQDFIEGKISAEEFADPYQVKFQAAVYSGDLWKGPGVLNEKLSTLFYVADQFNPATNRHHSEYDANELKKRVKALLES